MFKWETTEDPEFVEQALVFVLKADRFFACNMWFMTVTFSFFIILLSLLLLFLFWFGCFLQNCLFSSVWFNEDDSVVILSNGTVSWTLLIAELSGKENRTLSFMPTEDNGDVGEDRDFYEK